MSIARLISRVGTVMSDGVEFGEKKPTELAGRPAIVFLDGLGNRRDVGRRDP